MAYSIPLNPRQKVVTHMATEDQFGEVSLLDLMGVDLSQMDEMRFGDIFPRVFAQFECGEPTMDELKDNKAGSPTFGKVVGALIKFPWKCIGILDASNAKADGVEDPTTLVGKTHTEVAFVKAAMNLKYLKAFIADTGGNKNAPLGEAIKSVGGKRIQAIIRHRKDPNDSDKVYASLSKYKPIAA